MRQRQFRIGRILGGLAVAAVLAEPAGAVTLSLSPSSLSPAAGSSFSLDLVVSSLGSGGAPSVGAFDVIVVFDASALTFSGAAFGSLLGAVPTEATTDVLPGLDFAALAEVSFLPPASLDALQPDSFTLATLTFVAGSQVPSTVAVSSALLGDAFGRPIGLTVPFGSAVITPGPSALVPEPGAALLYAVGLLVVARARRPSRRTG